MNKTTKKSIAIGATIIAATAVTSVVQAEEASVAQPQTGTSATVSNIDRTAEVTKEAVDTAKEQADAAAKTVTEQEKVVSAADQKAKEAEAAEKTAAATYEKTKEAGKEATPENIAKAEEAIKTKEAGVKSAEESVKTAEEGVKSAETAEAESGKTYEEATKKVDDEKAKVALGKEEVKKAEQALNETTLTRAQETVTIAGNKLKDAESVNKAAQDELTRAKEFDASRQAKIDETKSALDKERTEKNIPALEQGLADAKANVQAKEKALAETKAKVGVAQAEVDEAQKALDKANADYQEKVAKLEQDRALRKIVIPAEYAKHDIKDYEWFIAHQDEYMKLQPETDYSQTGIGVNGEIVDLANLTAAQRKEIAEFVSQMLNDLNQQYWSQREPGKTITPIQLTVGGQEFADAIARGYSKFYEDNGGTPDKFNFGKNWGHQLSILRQYGASESLGGLLPEWHKENMGGYTMLNLKQEIAGDIRMMMFQDGNQANGHAKHLISLEGSGIGFSVSSGSLHILSTNRPTNQDKADYLSTDQEYNDSVKHSVEKEEQALQAAKAELATAQSNLENLQQVRAQRESELKDAKAKLVAQEEVLKQALQAALDAENDLKAKGLATTEAKAQVERSKQAVKSAEQAVQDAKDYLELLKSAPVKLAEAEKALTEAKAKTAEAKATLETEIAKLEALKLKAKASQEDYTRVFEAYQKLVKAKQWEETIRREQERIKHEEETRRNEPVRHEPTENKVMKTTVPIVTGTPGAITPATPQVNPTKQANTKELPSTGESASALGLMGVAMMALGFVGLKRKRESK
ncbi:SEC10/PgrA surface exclusion domain-containing protein [Streptococcus parasanguinis]|uniref:SEC10/PgrA surface exclusion domain-containing protein n=1 Tax=Streptococcus parasanguinis TaxID=1318 RepID=UPI00077943BE|nr:SEC10/PgrA surface exclusion domain-containing protein [Streptococcus parasanguinis]